MKLSNIISNMKKAVKRKNLYYISLFVVVIIMVICLIFYFLFGNTQLGNLFGNAFAGCLTGLIIEILSNIKNRQIEIYDNLLEKYKELMNTADKIKSEISNFSKNEKLEILMVYDIYLLIISFFDELENTNLDFKLNNEVKMIIKEMRMEICAFFEQKTITKDREEYIEKLKLFPEICNEIIFILFFKFVELGEDKEEVEKGFL